MDLFGMRLEELAHKSLMHILETHPHDGFRSCSGPCQKHRADTKPDSHIAGPVGIGLIDMIREA
ncbi:hypothetical protein [Pyruvatibacter sp.]|uniref:hypothetical protein n=1 Tax=Pyruvatibacter sp. TaxID=1981328 RepID=UPI0032EB28A0